MGKPEDKRSAWQKFKDGVSWVWDKAVVQPVKSIFSPPPSPPGSGCLCRILSFLSNAGGNLLILWLDVMILLVIVWAISLLAASLVAAASGPGSILNWLEWLASTAAIVIWFYIGIALAIGWGAVTALKALFC